MLQNPTTGFMNQPSEAQLTSESNFANPMSKKLPKTLRFPQVLILYSFSSHN